MGQNYASSIRKLRDNATIGNVEIILSMFFDFTKVLLCAKTYAGFSNFPHSNVIESFIRA